jgi:hypothetical protein
VVQTRTYIHHSVLQESKVCLKLTTKMNGETLSETERSVNTHGLLYTVNRCLCLQVSCPVTSLQVGTANYLDMGNSNHSHLQSNSPIQSRHKRREQERRDDMDGVTTPYCGVGIQTMAKKNQLVLP